MDFQGSLTTTKTELTEGKHYWEVELLSESVMNIFIGISRPNLDPRGEYTDRECTDGWFMQAHDGALCGNGDGAVYHGAGSYKQGDRV
jgi:hypothetical protein